MQRFDRWNSWFSRSFAYARFKDHHTEINDLYWSVVPVADYSEYLARNSTSATTPAMLFHASGPDARRIAPSIQEWQRNFKKFQNWVRLSSLLSALSYFETFISTIAILALRSDPLLRFGQSRAIDGTGWLKRNVQDDTTSQITPLVKGEWSARIKAYQNLFGKTPNLLKSEAGNLDKMRQLRNKVAHSFGRDPKYFEDPMTLAGESEKLRQDKLKKWLSIIDTCATDIDKHLLPAHIGEFELIWKYHHWRHETRDAMDKGFEENAAFSRMINRTYGSSPGRSFCKSLIKHYDLS